VEAKLSNVTAALSALNWATENDAILWICEQVDSDLLLLESLMRDAVGNVSAAFADIEALLSFLDDGNLQLISDWSLEAHGRQGSVSIRHEDGRRSSWITTGPPRAKRQAPQTYVSVPYMREGSVSAEASFPWDLGRSLLISKRRILQNHSAPSPTP
jgi:hypothetical protein